MAVTVEDYKAAMNELAAATAAYQPLFDYIRRINEATQYSHHTFLQSTFAMKIERKRGNYPDAKHKLDISKWPGADEVREKGQRLANAYNAAHEIYEALPEEDREYIKAPPWRPELADKR